VAGCDKIHASYILHKLRNVIGGTTGMSIDKVFASVDDNGNGTMDIMEFSDCVSLCFQELKKHEVDTLFKHFDRKGLGRITKDEFKAGLTEPMALENKMNFYLHDFITPLQTMTRKLQITPASIFDIFSKGKPSISLDIFK
jgi:Ca2+-binding EF-hand superfamily protein